uniref:Uncharacterized protein n=1 Tax=Piliocolobus tephrosceles TaxID=591936 RepID=A0A8C9GB48_9PRIM
MHFLNRKLVFYLYPQIPRNIQIPIFKEFLGTSNKLTKTCFLDCVKDHNKSKRFQEYHIQQNEALAAKAKLLGQSQ